MCQVPRRMVWPFRCESLHTVSPACLCWSVIVDKSRLVTQEYDRANLQVHITSDQDGVYKDQVLALSGKGAMKPTLLLIGKRLGHENVNPLYYNSLKVNSLLSTSLSSVWLNLGRRHSWNYLNLWE